MLAGIDIGGTKCVIVKGDKSGRVTGKVSFATTGCRETLERIYKEVGKLTEITAIGISCGGPLDEKRGIILSPPNLPGWDEVHIKEELEVRFGVPVNLRNDANACAVAEWRYGAGRGCNDMVFLTFGTGLGAGIIANGRLLSGSRGLAGEVGHIRLAGSGPVGYGKTGSFEGFCSGGGLAKMGRAIAKAAMENGDMPLFVKGGCIDNITAADIAAAARSGDKYARKAFRISGKRLGEGLAVICDVLDPELIIIGSIFARCRDLLEPYMLPVLKSEALAPCPVTVPLLGERIGDVAAIAVAAEAEFC